MRRSWPGWSRVIVLLLGLSLGAGFGLGLIEPTARAVDTQELFQAVDSWLRAAHVQAPDLPKSVIRATRIGDDRYLVQMQMQVGEGWFEVWKEGDRWQVKGRAPPQ